MTAGKEGRKEGKGRGGGSEEDECNNKVLIKIRDVFKIENVGR